MDMNRNPTGKGGFQKGVSGNPAGRPKEIREVKALAREHTAEALDTLAQIMRDHKAPQAARVSAARELLDRGYGRAESSVNAKIETPEKKPDFSVLSPEQREVWKRGHAMLAPLLELVLHERSGESTNGNGHGSA